jgi:GGDEF domain-containing protein
MNRKILIFYYIISLLFLLVVLGFTAWRFKVTLDRNLEQVENAFADLKLSALSTYLAEGSFASEYFKYNLRQQASLLPRLLAVSVRSPVFGVEYLWARNRQVLLAEPSAPAGPEYRLQKVRDRLLHAPFTQDYVLEGAFRVLEWQDLSPLLRELFYLLVAYLVITAAALVAVSSGRKPALAAHEPAGAEAAEGYVPLPARRMTAALRPQGPAIPAAGLGPREQLPSRLEHELERAASSDQDLTLLLMGLDPHQAGAFGQLAHQVLNAFPFRDLCFQYDERTCAVILPDKDLSQCLKDARTFQRKLGEVLGAGRQAVSMGLAARNGRLANAARLLLESSKALERALAEGGGHIVAFQADPEKFRKTLAG